MWKNLYGHSSRDHGTLGYFRSLLNRSTVTSDVKKAVDANLEFLDTVTKGHILASACRILGITKLDSELQLPPGIVPEKQPGYVRRIASQVVEECTLIDAFGEVAETNDHVYNYARVLCHYGTLVLEFRDAVKEGDGERVFRCWRVLLPHFLASQRTKYSLEALRLQFQVRAILSPQLAHQILWDRFVNTRGGLGRNIQCDLYNEHIVKLIKHIIISMGANLTEQALQRAARSVSTLHTVCKKFDQGSGVPVTTSAHSTKKDKADVEKVVVSVLTNDLLQIIPGRKHSAFKDIHLNPLWKWDKQKAIAWIERKKKDFIKHKSITEEVAEEDEGGEEEYRENSDNDTR